MAGLLEAAIWLDSETVAVWEKARPVAGRDPFWIRQDVHGNEIHRAAYGDSSSKYGWQTDHIRPKALGGSDDISNLRPVSCRSNAKLGALLFDRSVLVPAVAAGPVVETAGAGDAFVGGFAAALARGDDPLAATRFGCAVAGLSVTRAGTAPSMPTLSEVEALMARA